VSGQLAGKTAIVTGAASGIGLATVKRFLAEGARVVMADCNAPALARACTETGGETLAIVTDVGEPAGVTAMFAQAEERFGRIDAVVNCAGIANREPIETLTLDAWNAVLRVNLTGTFLVAQAAARTMVAQGGGSIVLFASRLYLGGRGSSAYSASKGGVVSLMHTLAFELGPHAVRVNAIAPGFTETPMTANRGKTPPPSSASLGRNAQPEEMAAVALFLAGDDSSYVSGHVLFADGADPE
jgi:3-oxoacyl-[acyl-carrier protein] reductase